MHRDWGFERAFPKAEARYSRSLTYLGSISGLSVTERSYERIGGVSGELANRFRGH